ACPELVGPDLGAGSNSGAGAGPAAGVDGMHGAPPMGMLPGVITPPLTSSRIASSTFRGNSTIASRGTTTTYPLNDVGVDGMKTVTMSCPTASFSGLTPPPVTRPIDQ